MFGVTNLPKGMGESWVSPWPSFPLSSESELVLRVRHSSDALSDTLRVQEKGSVTKDSRGQFSPRMLLEVSKTAGMTLFLITHLSAHCHPTESPIALTPGLLGNWGRLTQGTQTSALHSPPPSPPHNSSWRESKLCLFR